MLFSLDTRYLKSHLTSKCVSRAVHTNAIDALSPLQVEVGIPFGCESIVHSVVSLQEDISIPPESRCALLVDSSNAFNSVNRACKVRSQIPSWVESCYTVPNHFCILETTSSSAVAEFNKEILYVPYVLLSPSTRLLSRSRGKSRSCLLTHGTLMMAPCVVPSATLVMLSP